MRVYDATAIVTGRLRRMRAIAGRQSTTTGGSPRCISAERATGKSFRFMRRILRPESHEEFDCRHGLPDQASSGGMRTERARLAVSDEATIWSPVLNFFTSLPALHFTGQLGSKRGAFHGFPIPNMRLAKGA